MGLSPRAIGSESTVGILTAADSPPPPPSCTAGRKYAKAGPKAVANAIGAKSDVKTRYGKLCGEPNATSSAYQVAYAGVQNGSATKWAQTGWGRERDAGSTTIKKYRYAELKGNGYFAKYDVVNAPAEGSTHNYKCELNKATGKWIFYYDGTEWYDFQDDYWKDNTGTHVAWTGEIYNKEDDMPGTNSDKCNFTACQYRVSGGAYQNAGLVAADVTSDDANEWGAQWVSGTAFNIWDKKPL